MEKSTKILIGVGVVGVVGLLIYNKAKAAKPAAKSGGVGVKPSTTIPSVSEIPTNEPTNPIIDPTNGKLVPNKPKKPNPSSKDTTDPNANPQFDMSKGIGSGGGGGGDKAVNNPDSNSGKFKKVDPNAKDENWIKALQKKQNKGTNLPKKQKQTAQVDCYTNPYDPTCQKVKDCYYNPYDPSCSQGQYDYKKEGYYDNSYYQNNYENKYPDQPYNYNSYNYNYNPPASYYDNSGGGSSYNSGGGYDYSGKYDSGGGFGGGPSDFGYLYQDY